MTPYGLSLLEQARRLVIKAEKEAEQFREHDSLSSALIHLAAAMRAPPEKSEKP